MINTKAKTPSQYINSLSEPVKAQVQSLDRLIREYAPNLKPYIQSGMLAYGSYHYRYASGRVGDWCIIGLASQKNYISLYICATENGKYIAEMYKKELPKANIGKSCIRFKKVEDLDLKVLKEIIKKAAKFKE